MADEQRSRRIEELQQQVNERVRQAVDEMQRELRERLRRAGDELVGALEGKLDEGSSPLPESFLSSEELTPLTDEAAAEARGTARRESAASLTEALRALDGAGSQSAILDTLAWEAGRYAGRTAVFLAREKGLELWGTHGWDEVMDEARVEYADEGPWSAESLGSGTVELASSYCGELCSQVEAPLPSAAILVPLVLRDRLAAVVYADVGNADGGGEELAREALQSLTYVAGLALETLPFRQRESTSTLRRAEDFAGPAAQVWAAAATLEGTEESPPADGVGRDQDSDLEADFGDGGEGDDDFAYDFDSEPPAAPESEPEPATEDSQEPAATWASEPESTGFEVPGFDADPDDTAADDTAGDPGDETVDDSGFGGSEATDVEVADSEFGDGEADSAYSSTATGSETVYAPVPPPPAVEAEVEEVEEVEEPAESEAEAEPAGPVGDPEPPAGGSQVAPPTDVDGPGRAFEAAEPRTEEESRHEEARRLARLLVSEIRLYNEDQVDEGRRHNDVYQRLKEDIDRSRQMYEERVDPGVRDSTDYFYDELVRNLGGGNEETLGL